MLIAYAMIIIAQKAFPILLNYPSQFSIEAK